MREELPGQGPWESAVVHEAEPQHTPSLKGWDGKVLRSPLSNLSHQDASSPCFSK